MKKRNLIFLFLSFFFLSASAWQPDPVVSNEQDYYYKLKKSWQHMQNVFEKVNMHYVEEIDPYPLVKAGIDGMLQQLDPYTVFIEEDGERRLRMITTGKYGGLGMEIGMKNKRITVISPMDNSPAIRAGVRAGDIITKIDGQDVEGQNINKVSSLLRGEIGTTIDLSIQRQGYVQDIELTLTRSEIIIEDVGYAGFIEPGVAYISLNGFTDKAAREVKRAIRQLREQQEIEKVVLDLRGNPGGLLDAAVDIVNIFIPKGETVVYTKGFRENEVVFKTRNSPLLPDVPLAVLVDEGSASASEIVAGALQDMDRAVIVGEKTFGKGLVQKVYNVDKNSDTKVKITTAKYYIPSGRSIQKKDYGFENDVVVDAASDESMVHDLFFTQNKREVFDHGGIQPDVFVKSDSLDYVVIELIRKNMLFNFAVKYNQDNPEWSGDFKVNDQILSDFKSYLKNNNFDYSVEGSNEIKRLKKIVGNKPDNKEMLALIDQLEQKLISEKEIYLSTCDRQIKKFLKMELAEKYFGRRGSYKYSVDDDAQVNNAVEVLKNQSEYNKILAVN
ncbi:MAG: S41 family peptidase [Calditrichaeota bacterium]|nr:MAG: S41 family peptidase [Calditrichota bacterium]MBL1208084.1 S41 family peptidase [Calditrichota bacterium]NOG47922.1 S41 family peptidase [Calditrichota bacterium]